MFRFFARLAWGDGVAVLRRAGRWMSERAGKPKLRRGKTCFMETKRRVHSSSCVPENGRWLCYSDSSAVSVWRGYPAPIGGAVCILHMFLRGRGDTDGKRDCFARDGTRTTQTFAKSVQGGRFGRRCHLVPLACETIVSMMEQPKRISPERQDAFGFCDPFQKYWLPLLTCLDRRAIIIFDQSNALRRIHAAMSCCFFWTNEIGCLKKFGHYNNNRSLSWYGAAGKIGISVVPRGIVFAARNLSDGQVFLSSEQRER